MALRSAIRRSRREKRGRDRRAADAQKRPGLTPAGKARVPVLAQTVGRSYTLRIETDRQKAERGEKPGQRDPKPQKRGHGRSDCEKAEHRQAQQHGT